MSSLMPEVPDSRYAPIPQKKYHCVPACLQMILTKHELHVPSQDEIGYNLGVIVPSDEAGNFDPVRVGIEPDGCHGTHLEKPEYDFNTVARALGWGVKMTCRSPDNFTTSESLLDYLTQAEEADKDVILCYDFPALYENGSGGHTNLFDRVRPEGIRVIEPIEIAARPNYLWRTQDPTELLTAMQVHADYMGGTWEIELT
ncbi:MAG: hypothetical protein U0520_01095 [Candidatus Saccharimonadales bacterium]